MATGGAGAAAPQRAAPRPFAPSVADAGLFDELTEGDLQSVAQPGMPSAAPGPSGNTGKLLQEQAATAGGGGSGRNFRVGPLASPWIRLVASYVDSFVMFFLLVPFALLNEFVMVGEGLSAAVGLIGLILIVAIYAIMVTKSGQTPGKKLCKIRIVRADNQQLPGFVKGVVVRGWLGTVVFYFPILGLVGMLLIFGARRQTLWDIMAGTIVVES